MKGFPTLVMNIPGPRSMQRDIPQCEVWYYRHQVQFVWPFLTRTNGNTPLIHDVVAHLRALSPMVSHPRSPNISKFLAGTYLYTHLKRVVDGALSSSLPGQEIPRRHNGTETTAHAHCTGTILLAREQKGTFFRVRLLLYRTHVVTNYPKPQHGSNPNAARSRLAEEKEKLRDTAGGGPDLLYIASIKTERIKPGRIMLVPRWGVYS